MNTHVIAGAIKEAGISIRKGLETGSKTIAEAIVKAAEIKAGGER